jgi:hypothetical protein
VPVLGCEILRSGERPPVMRDLAGVEGHDVEANFRLTW